MQKIGTRSMALTESFDVGCVRIGISLHVTTDHEY
eukprot:COSAG02_NODE_5029_length_4717_cov_3.581854_2_plen_35_part_00